MNTGRPLELEGGSWDAYYAAVAPSPKFKAAMGRMEVAKDMGLCQRARLPWHTLVEDDGPPRVMCTLCGKMFRLHRQAATHWTDDHHDLDLVMRTIK